MQNELKLLALQIAKLNHKTDLILSEIKELKEIKDPTQKSWTPEMFEKELNTLDKVAAIEVNKDLIAKNESQGFAPNSIDKLNNVKELIKEGQDSGTTETKVNEIVQKVERQLYENGTGFATPKIIADPKKKESEAPKKKKLTPEEKKAALKERNDRRNLFYTTPPKDIEVDSPTITTKELAYITDKKLSGLYACLKKVKAKITQGRGITKTFKKTTLVEMLINHNKDTFALAVVINKDKFLRYLNDDLKAELLKQKESA